MHTRPPTCSGRSAGRGGGGGGRESEQISSLGHWRETPRGPMALLFSERLSHTLPCAAAAVAAFCGKEKRSQRSGKRRRGGLLMGLPSIRRPSSRPAAAQQPVETSRHGVSSLSTTGGSPTSPLSLIRRQNQQGRATEPGSQAWKDKGRVGMRKIDTEDNGRLGKRHSRSERAKNGVVAANIQGMERELYGQNPPTL